MASVAVESCNGVSGGGMGSNSRFSSSSTSAGVGGRKMADPIFSFLFFLGVGRIRTQGISARYLLRMVFVVKLYFSVGRHGGVLENDFDFLIHVGERSHQG